MDMTLKLLYDSRTDDLDAILAKARTITFGNGTPILLERKYWTHGKTKGTAYEGCACRPTIRINDLPGLQPIHLFDPFTYDRDGCPDESLVLYHDGLDLHAMVEHAFGSSHTIIRYIPDEKELRDKLWQYSGKTSEKAWHKIMRYTVPAHEASPDLMTLARPCRLAACLCTTNSMKEETNQ